MIRRAVSSIAGRRPERNGRAQEGTRAGTSRQMGAAARRTEVKSAMKAARHLAAERSHRVYAACYWLKILFRIDSGRLYADGGSAYTPAMVGETNTSLSDRFASALLDFAPLSCLGHWPL